MEGVQVQGTFTADQWIWLKRFLTEQRRFTENAMNEQITLPASVLSMLAEDTKMCREIAAKIIV